MLGIKRAGDRVEIFGISQEWEQFRAAVLFVSGACSKDKSLPAFTTVALEVSDDTAGLVSTDRYRLHAVSLRGEFDQFLKDTPADRYLIDGAKLAAAVKAKKSGAFMLTIEAGAWSLSAGDEVYKSDLVKADFPNFRQIWRGPSDEAPSAISFNPAILGGTLATIERAYGKSDQPTRISFTGDNCRPILLDNFDASARALVMPCRVV